MCGKEKNQKPGKMQGDKERGRLQKREKKIIRRELGSVLKFNNRVKVDINHVLRTTETGMFTYSAPNFFVKVRDGERDCRITYGGAPPGTSIRD